MASRLLCFLIMLLPACWPPPAAAQQMPITLGGDRYMTSAAGAIDLTGLQRALISLEDRFLPLTLGTERSRPRLILGALYRTGKLIGLDVPQDHMLLVVQHEVFGHGARLREIGLGRTRYSFDGPIPYGHGGAVTSFEGEVPDTPLSLLTVETAGIEAQNVLADVVSEIALSRGRMHYREAWLYFESRWIGMTYIRSARERSKEGHDVADFVRTFKDACTPPGCAPITLSDVRRGARLTLADPLLYFALYGFTSSYIARGDATSPIPMIPLGRGMRFLPSVGFQLTTYGMEYLIRNMFVSGQRREGRGQKVTRVTVRVGTTGGSRPWAIDLRLSDMRVIRRWHIGAAADFWRQPQALAPHTSVPLRTGAAIAGTFTVPLRSLARGNWLSASITTGYKAEGFLPGEQLGGGLTWRVGVTIGGRP